MNKLITTTSVIFLLLVPIFGVNFLANVVGNILLIIVLIPLLIFAIALIAINNLKTKVKQCENCGSTVMVTLDQCVYCGYNFPETNNIGTKYTTDASQKTIEVEAEEIN
mgnify:FL=1